MLEIEGQIKMEEITLFNPKMSFRKASMFSHKEHVVVLQEYEIDKALGIKGPEDVAKMGIAEYNKQCRSIVMRYANEWEVRVCVCEYSISTAKKECLVQYKRSSKNNISHVQHREKVLFSPRDKRESAQLLLYTLFNN